MQSTKNQTNGPLQAQAPAQPAAVFREVRSHAQRGALSVTQENFSEFANLSLKQLTELTTPKAETFRQLLGLAKKQWTLNQVHYAHQDSYETLRDIFTKPSSQSVLLWGTLPARHSPFQEKILVGAGLVITEVMDFPKKDQSEIPWEFVKTSLKRNHPSESIKVVRGIRAFVSRTAHILAPTERPLDLITAKANEIARNAYVITKINLGNPQARAAFTGQGYEPTGIITPDQQYEWLISPPFSNQALKEYTASRMRLQLMTREQTVELAPVANYFDPQGRDLAILGNKQDIQTTAAEIARLFPYSQVYGFVSDTLPTTKRELPNLLFVKQSGDQQLFNEHQIGAAYLVHDPADGPKRFSADLKQLVDSCLPDSCIIIKIKPGANLTEINQELSHQPLRRSSTLAQVDGSYTIIAHTAAKNGGVRIIAGPAAEREKTDFLNFQFARNKATGTVWEMASFANDITMDVLPCFDLHGQLYVGMLVGRPRPLVEAFGRNLGRHNEGAYRSEPISGFFEPAAKYTSVAEYLKAARLQPTQTLSPKVSEHLRVKAQINERPASITMQHYYSSPGGLGELVLGCIAPVSPFTSAKPVVSPTGFNSTGKFQPVLAQRALAAAQIGSFTNGRLERLLYLAFMQSGRDPGQWLGEPLEQPPGNCGAKAESIQTFVTPPFNQGFEVLSEKRERHYLKLSSAKFSEQSGSGLNLSVNSLDFIEPRGFSSNSLAILPITKMNDEIYVGLEQRELPAPQMHGFSSTMYTIPAYRLPLDVTSVEQASIQAIKKVQHDFGAQLGPLKDLGQPFAPTAALAPEICYLKYAVLEKPTEDPRLHWFKLTDLLRNIEHVHDGHTMTGLLRLGHGLGFLQPEQKLPANTPA